MLTLNKANKKGQTAETITWIVATLIIVVILGISIFTASLLGKAKSIDSSKIKFSSEEVGLLDVKTSLAYSINNSNMDEISIWVNEVENVEENSE